MGLMLPKPWIGLPSSNLNATPSPGAVGAVVTANATAHNKGAYVTLIASTAYEVWGVTLCMMTNSTAAAQVNNLYDLAIGAAASEVVIVPDILATHGANTTNSGQYTQIFLPIRIASGTRISVRSQSNVVSKTSQVEIFVYGGRGIPPWPVFARAISIGTVSTAGTNTNGLAHTAGNTGAESAWTNFGSTLSRDIAALVPMVGTNTLTVMNNLQYHLEMGVASTTFMEWTFATNSAEFVNDVYPQLPLYKRIPSGTQMMLRAECSGTGETLQYAALGFY